MRDILCGFEINISLFLRLGIQGKILRSGESHYDHRVHGFLLAFYCYFFTEVAELCRTEFSTKPTFLSSFGIPATETVSVYSTD